MDNNALVEMSEERHDDNADAVEAEAASALTVLSGPPKEDEEIDDCEFEIPERFTKSGRKKAVPFPVKVRNDKSICRRFLLDIRGFLPGSMSV